MEKWALVTGAAVRVGRECALYLAGRGYGLILHYFRSYEPVRELESLLQRQGTPTRTVACDFAQTDAVDRCLDLAREYAVMARFKLDSFPESVYKDSLLTLADYIVSRDR